MEKGMRLENARRHRRESRSKSRLHRGQPAEKPPGQPDMIAENDPMRFGNHVNHIDPCAASDNEPGLKKKGPNTGPFMQF